MSKLKQWNKLLKLKKSDRRYFKVIENHEGDDWLICFGRDAETNKDYSITTNKVHASELGDISEGAKADAKFFVEVLNLKYNGKFKEVEDFIKTLKPTK